MKKLGLLLIAILAISMMAMIAAPVLAARTPKANQVFVKVVDTAGNPVGGANVLLYEGNDWWTKDAGTSWVGPVNKHSGIAVVSLTRDTNFGSWSSATTFSVDVQVNTAFYYFYDYPFSSTLSASIEITIPI